MNPSAVNRFLCYDKCIFKYVLLEAFMEYCTHVYYGTGKGKTTAAVGLAVRAAGAGCRVLFCQFLKSGETAELQVLKNLPGLTILRPEGRYPFAGKMTESDRLGITEEHNRILDEIGRILSGNEEQTIPVLVVLDELAWAFHYDLISKEKVLSLLDTKKAEFVITGRICIPELLARADYITNLQAEKHPYERGVSARKGIEF